MGMDDFNSQDLDFSEWIDLQYGHHGLQEPQQSLPYGEDLWCDPANYSPPHGTCTNTNTNTNTYGTPESFNSYSTDKSSSEERQMSSLSSLEDAPKKRQRQSSEESQSDGALVRAQKKRKVCQDGDDPEGSCKRCLEHPDKITLQLLFEGTARMQDLESKHCGSTLL